MTSTTSNLTPANVDHQQMMPLGRHAAAFEASLDQLKAFFTAVQCITKESLLKFGPHGVTSTFVDPAHVAAGRLELVPARGMDGPGCEIGLDAKKVLDRLKAFEKKGAIAVVVTNEGGKRAFVMKQGRLTRSLRGNDPTGISEPKLPRLDLPAQARIPVADLGKALQAAEDTSDHVTIDVKEGVLTMTAQGEEEDDVDRAVFDDEGTITGEARSRFSLDYLRKMQKAANEVAKEVTLRVGVDLPLVMEATGAGDGLRALLLMAPRID